MRVSMSVCVERGDNWGNSGPSGLVTGAHRCVCVCGLLFIQRDGAVAEG